MRFLNQFPIHAIIRVTLGLSLGLTLTAAELAVDPLFTDHMVLQRGVAVPVWGTAAPGERVTVAFAGQQVGATADADGKWRATLAAMAASDAPRGLVVRGGREIALADVLVGDVWIASGQSNMEAPISSFKTVAAQVRDAHEPSLRLLLIKREGADQPRDAAVIDGAFKTWQQAGGETLQHFSPAAFFFGSKLVRERKVPIGIIEGGVGGTRIEPWIPPAAWATLGPAQRSRTMTGRFPATNLFNAMISPLTRLPITGVIWYQGESSAPWALLYAAQFRALIDGWRAAWNQGDFPFLFVQIAPFKPVDGDQSGERWAWLREAQATGLTRANTAMVVTTDLGEFESIHPQDKRPVGERLADSVGPDGRSAVNRTATFERLEIRGSQAVVHLRNVHAGLTTRRVAMNKAIDLLPGQDPGAFVVPAGTVAGFTICGADHAFVPATATIIGDTVAVQAEGVPSPVAVRYGWADFPLCNLATGDGFPVSPFRSDDFPAPDFLKRLIGVPFTGRETDLGSPLRLTAASAETTLAEATVAGRPGHRATRTGAYAGRYVYATVGDAAFRDGAAPAAVLTLLYYDDGPETIDVLYDSADAGVTVAAANPGAWKPAGKIRVDGTGTWRTVEIPLADARFAGRLNGADIRLQWPEDSDAVIGGIYLRRR